MIKNNEPYLIEYNIRMGDPECQVILPRLKTDLVEIILKTISNKLKTVKMKWFKSKSMTIVLCSKGYPGSYKKNSQIKNIDKIKLSKKDFIFHCVLSGFFDLNRVTTLDILIVGLVSAAVPFCGNSFLAGMLDRASLSIASQNARRRLISSLAWCYLF